MGGQDQDIRQEEQHDDKYEKEWEELEKEEAEKEKAEGSSQKEEDSEDSDEDIEQDPEEKESPEQEEIEKPDLEAMAKDAREAKSALEEATGQIKNLELELERLKSGHGSQEEVDEAEKKIEDTLKAIKEKKDGVYEDFPEFKEVLDPIFDVVEGLQKKVNDLKSGKDDAAIQEAEEKRKARDKELDEFDKNVKPEIVKAHPDFDQIVLADDGNGGRKPNPEYFEWAESLPKEEQARFLDSNKPEDIIEGITRFKEFKSSPEYQQQENKKKDKREKEKEHKKAAARSISPGSSSKTAGQSSKKDSDDYDAGWEEAEKLLEKED